MDVFSSQVQNVPTLQIEGEIDHGNAPRLENAIEQQLQDGSRFLLIDLSQVDYIDSGGISVLLTTLRRLRNTGWLGVINPSAGVHRLLDMVGLTIDRGFRVFSDSDEARRTILGLGAATPPTDTGIPGQPGTGPGSGETAGDHGPPES